VPLEGEVDLVDAVSLRGGAEGRLRARRAAAVENAVLALYTRSFPGDVLSDCAQAVKRVRYPP
jgi:hypothetical protein